MTFVDTELIQIKITRSGGRMETVGKRKADQSDLDKFVNEQNVALYRKLLAIDKDETRRRAISQLLADQMAKLRKK